MNMLEDIKKQLMNIPMQSMNFFLFCLSGVLIFVFGGIIPSYRSRVIIDEKIQEARYRIEEYDALQPLYSSLKRTPDRVSSSLTLPTPAALQRTQINMADSSFRDIAGRSGMKVVSIVPDMASFGRDSRMLAVNVSLKGEFENFRNVLKKLGELPYVDHVEEFAIHRVGNSRALDFTLKIVLTVS